MIEVEHIVKEYGATRAVDDISFSLEKGKIYGFLGPNGAGKSTTMNIMTGYLAPTSGCVRINGHDILTDAESAKKDIGYLPEIPPVSPDLTVAEYLRYAAGLKKIPSKQIRDVVAKSLQMTGLGAYQTRLIKNLSKGYRQRVGLAGAITGLPQIIILDEPTVGLDPQQIIDIRKLITSLRDEHTVILSSHILSEISSVCDELIIISNGKKVAEGTLSMLEATYCHDNGFVLRALSDSANVARVLQNISCVRSIEMIKTDEADPKSESSQSRSSAFRIMTDDSPYVQEQVARDLFEAGIAVAELYHDTKSLEEVFLNITSVTTFGKNRSGIRDGENIDSLEVHS